MKSQKFGNWGSDIGTWHFMKGEMRSGCDQVLLWNSQIINKILDHKLYNYVKYINAFYELRGNRDI